MKVATKDSMADDELEEIEGKLSNLIFEEEVFQLVQIKYKSYSHAQIAGFIYSSQEEGCLVPEAEKKASIPRSTAYRMWNEFNECGSKELPGLKKSSKRGNRGRPPNLIEEPFAAIGGNSNSIGGLWFVYPNGKKTLEKIVSYVFLQKKKGNS